MSSTEEVPSAQQLLNWDENQLIRLLNGSRAKGIRFEITHVPGLRSLSDPQKDVLSRKLSAAATKAGPIDTDDLFKRLTERRDPQKGGDAPALAHSRLQGGHIRSPTTSPPPPEGNAKYEAFCYHELLRIGGRPAVPLEHLSSGSGDAQADSQAIAPWLADTNLHDGDGDVPPVFSTQLEDWMSFRQRWQWDNRGKAAGKHGFPAYLEWQRKMYLHKGEVDMVADPLFEATTRRIWDHEPAPLEVSRGEGFAGYVRAVEERLASHHFTQPFRLFKDPRRQDGWTTWVEYLNYIYWSRDRHAAAMKRAEPQYRRAWEKLERVNWSQFRSTTTTETIDQQLSALQAKTLNVTSFLRETRAYRRAEAACQRQELRAQWVLEQLPLIETNMSETANNVNRNARVKRKREGDQVENALRPQQKRTRRPVGQRDSAPEPGTAALEGAVAVIPDPGVAVLTAPDFKPRRSQRRGVGDATAKGRPPEPGAGVPKARQKVRATETRRKTRSSAL